MIQANIQNYEIENNSDKLLNFKRQRPDQIFEIIKIKNKRKWTKEEDTLLVKLAEKYKEKHWKEISKNFNNKNALQCFSRYKRIRPGIVKGSWSREEDEQIIELVEIFGKSWSKISKVLVTRNGKQIRDRFINVLDPEIKKGKFTEEEDKALVRFYLYYGPKWATIAKHFPNRTADMIKNRFHSSIKKVLFGNRTYLSRNFLLEKKKLTFEEINDKITRTTSENEIKLEINDTYKSTTFKEAIVPNTQEMTSSHQSLSPKNECSIKSTKTSFDLKDENTEVHDQIEYPSKSQPNNFYNDDLYKEYYLLEDQNLVNINENFYDNGELLGHSDRYFLSQDANSPEVFNFEDYFTV